MQTSNVESLQRVALTSGFILMGLSFTAGLLVPLYANVRTGMAAHVLGITSSLFLMACAFSLPMLKLKNWQRSLMIWPPAIGFIVGFLTQVLGGLKGLSEAFIVTAAGMPMGDPFLESVATFIVKYALTPIAFLPCVIALFGLYQAGKFK